MCFRRRLDDSGNDRIFQILSRPSLRLAFMRHRRLDIFIFPVSETLMFDQASEMFDDGPEPSSEIRILHCIYFGHVDFMMYNSCRHGSKVHRSAYDFDC